MNTTTLEIESVTQQLVEHNGTSVSHSYDIDSVSAKYIDELKTLICNEIYYNGDVTLLQNNSNIRFAIYETTDTSEISESTANSIAQNINTAIAKLAAKHGGYNVIAAN